MKLIYLFIITSTTLISCDKKSNIDYIEVKYLPSEISISTPYLCGSMDEDWDEILKTEINNDKFLIEFEKHYNELYDYNDTNQMDVRIRLIIHFKNNRIDTLCTGKYFGIIKNGKRQQNYKKIIKLVKEEIDY